jgi:hypothetical protein
MRGGDFNNLGPTGKDGLGGEERSSELLDEAERVRESHGDHARRVGFLHRLRLKLSKHS